MLVRFRGLVDVYKRQEAHIRQSEWKRVSSICFFFKQKTAYGVRLSLVGYEMCIRNRHEGRPAMQAKADSAASMLRQTLYAVFYKHLTLPTNREVKIWVVAGALKKKKSNACGRYVHSFGLL